MIIHWTMILTAIWLANTLAAFVTVFWSKREVSTIWAWLLVLTLVPVLGFIIYWFTGRRITSKQIFGISTQKMVGAEQLLKNNRSKRAVPKKAQELVTLFNTIDNATLTFDNDIQLLNDGEDFFAQLFKDIDAAKHHINIEFFTIYDDQIGRELVKHLTKKAKAGVIVRVIYDQFGSRGRHRQLFKHLVAAGGTVIPFLMRRFQILSLRVNFRLHRKIVVIDGEVGYTGGYNVGDQYLGRKKKFGYWRDTQLRVRGEAVLALQTRFFMDWNATSHQNESVNFEEVYFPLPKHKAGDAMMQIVSSGPESKYHKIKQGYLKMIASARRSITIYSPYFVPDQSVLEALELAILSGIKVRLLIPDRPDHMFVYRATQYYASEIAHVGGEVFQYNNGFLHAKIVMIDDEIASVGSANMDIRSFELNFESNAFVYNEAVVAEIQKQLEIDLKRSQLLTPEYFDKQPTLLKLRQKFSRLLSPIL